jgi:hypothetical protein
VVAAFASEINTWTKRHHSTSLTGARMTAKKTALLPAPFGAPTRGTAPLRLALAGATRSGTAGVGSLLPIRKRRYAPSNWSQLGTTIIFGATAVTNRYLTASYLDGVCQSAPQAKVRLRDLI